MNLFNGANLTPPMSSVAKMNGRGSGRARRGSAFTPLSRLTGVDILERHEPNNVDNESTSPRRINSPPTQQMSTAVTSDSSSDPEDFFLLNRKVDSRRLDQSGKSKSRKFLFSSPLESQVRFDELPRLSQSISSPNQLFTQRIYQKTDTSNGLNRMKKIYTRNITEHKEDPTMGQLIEDQLLATPISLKKKNPAHDNDNFQVITSDEEVNVDTRECSSDSSPAVIELSDDEEALSTAPSSKSQDKSGNIPIIDCREAFLDNKVLNCTPVRKRPHSEMRRILNTPDRADTTENENNDDCIIVKESSKMSSSESANMNASLLDEPDLPGFSTPVQPFRHHIPGDNEPHNISRKTNSEAIVQATEVISSDSDTNKTPPKQVKPSSVNLSADKKYTEEYLLKKKARGREGEVAKGVVKKLRLKEVVEFEGDLTETGKISGLSKVRSNDEETINLTINAKRTADDREKWEEVFQEQPEKQLSGERKTRRKKPGPHRPSTADETSGSDKIAEDSERKNDETMQEAERQSSGEKKKRGRKPKVKPRSPTISELSEDKPGEPHQNSIAPEFIISNTVGGFTFNTMSKSQAEARVSNEPIEKKKRGRKPGGKNRPKPVREKYLKDIEKKPKRKYRIRSKLNLNNNQPAEPVCCLEKTCCHLAGCTHGNNHKKPGKLPSLPDNPEFVFVEQIFQNDIQKFNENMVAGKNSDASGTNDESGETQQSAVIQFPLDVVTNGGQLNGKEVMGFKVALPPTPMPTNNIQRSGDVPEDMIPKVKIVQDELLPKGTINHVLSKRSPPREKCGIRSTVPSRRCLNPSLDSRTLDTKISSAFFNIWQRIPEIAVLMKSPSKSIFGDESSDEDAMESDQALEEVMRRPERRKSHLSDSISNTDVKNGHVKSVGLLNGLFSDPHILPPSQNHPQSYERKSRISSRAETEQPTKDKKPEDKLKNKSNNISRLTKENLTRMNQSTNAQDGLDVMSHIMRQMQMPGKPVFPGVTSLSPRGEFTKSAGDSKKSEKTSLTENRKRAAETGLIEPETKKIMRKGHWSLNDDDASSGISRGSRPSAYPSQKSRSSYLLDSLNNKSPARKTELVQAWLCKESEESRDAEDCKSLDNSHSPHSAKTYLKSPYERGDDLQMEDTVDTVLEVSGDPEDNLVGGSDLSPATLSSKTASGSLRERSSGIGTEQGKANSFERDGDSDRPGIATTKALGASDDQEKEEEEEDDDDDALFLDVEDDDLLMEEGLEKTEDKEPKLKNLPRKSSPPRAKTPPPPVTNPNESPRRRPPILKPPPAPRRAESFLATTRPADWDEDELRADVSTSDLYQMSNIDRYISQNRRECNDQYSAADDPDPYAPGDDNDIYEPVPIPAEKIFFPKDPRQFFRGLCYAYLKKGNCSRLDCPFDNNKYTYHLQNLSKAQPMVIEAVLLHAISESYFHALLDIYPEAVKILGLQSILRVLARIRAEAEKHKTKTLVNYSAYKFYQESMKPTVDALSLKDHSPAAIIEILSKGFLVRDDDDIKKLMRVLIASKKIPTGKHWDTFKDLIKLLESSPPQFLVSLILNDCMRFEKPRDYLKAVYENVIRRIPEPTLQGIDRGLLRPFRWLSEPGWSERAEGEVVNDGSGTPVPDGELDFGERLRDNQVASPDGNSNAEELMEVGRDGSAPQLRRKSVKERLGPRGLPVRARVERRQELLDLIPIDRIGRPTSLYKQVLWHLHVDLTIIRLSLRYRAYDRTIETLNGAKNRVSTGIQPFAKGFYHILCREIIASADHLEAILKRSGNQFIVQADNGRYRINSRT